MFPVIQAWLKVSTCGLIHLLRLMKKSKLIDTHRFYTSHYPYPSNTQRSTNTNTNTEILFFRGG